MTSFHADLILNNRALSDLLFENIRLLLTLASSHQEENNKMRHDMGSVPDPKINTQYLHNYKYNNITVSVTCKLPNVYHLSRLSTPCPKISDTPTDKLL